MPTPCVDVYWKTPAHLILPLALSQHFYLTGFPPPVLGLCIHPAQRNDQEHPDSPSDDKLRHLAKVCATVLDKALLDEQQAVLHKAGAVFASESSDAVDDLAKFIGGRMRFDVCTLLTQIKERGILRVVGTTGLHTELTRNEWTIKMARFPSDPTVQVAASQQPLISNDLFHETWGDETEALPDLITNHRHRSQFLAVPILARTTDGRSGPGTLVGVLRLRNKTDEETHTDRPIDLLDFIESNMVADAISPVMSATETAIRRAETVTEMRHDLYDPIGMIQTAAKTVVDLENEGIALHPEMVHQKLEDIESLCEILSANVNQARVLTYGDIPYRFTLTLLRGEVVVKLTKLFDQLCKDVGLSGIRAGDFKEIPPLYVDKTMMHVAFYNLYRNAIKYADAGTEIEVTTSISREFYEISVSNQASEIGIDPAEFPRFFEKWYRGTAAKKRSEMGHGLGLFHVQTIVGKHKGRIFVTSVRDKITFTIALPRFLSRRSP